MIEPGVIDNHVPGNNMVVIGEVDDRQTRRVAALRGALEAADVSSPPVEDIRQSIWSKLAQKAPVELARAAQVATPTLDALVALAAYKAAAKGLYVA